jgi:hypothetical protein
MKIIILFKQAFSKLQSAVFLFFCVLCAQTSALASQFSNELREAQSVLRPGDILLVPLNCYVCNAIEKETGVPYSHSVVVANEAADQSQIFVYEAWGKTTRTKLSEIQSRAQKKQSLFHLRPREFFEGQSPTEMQLAEKFDSDFSKTQFDNEFLWNNVDENNFEKLYCAEFVVKFINTFLQNPQPPSPMSFGKLGDFWKKYYQQFSMPVPEGEPGASPSTLYSSSRFIKLGLLKPN